METMDTGYAKAEIDILNGKSINPSTQIIKELTSDDIAIDSITITTGCYDGNAVGVGNVHTSRCTITMDETDYIKIGTFFQLIFLRSGKGSIYEGSFFVNERPAHQGDKMTISAMGEPSTILDNHIPENVHDGVVKKTNPFYTTEGMTGQEIRQRYCPYLTYVSDDSAKFQIENYLYRAPMPYRRWNVETQDWIVDVGNYSILKVREVLAGLALHYGGNVVERNGSFYMTKKQGEDGGDFSVDDCDSSYEFSRETYGIRMVQQSKLPDIMVTKNGEPPYPYALYGTERQKRRFLVTATNALNADVKYDHIIECDWLGTGIGPDSSTGMYPIDCIVQGDLKYNTGNFSFVGYNEKLYAGNKIKIHIGDNVIDFVIGEMQLKWDGGFTTDISCQFSSESTEGEVKSFASTPSLSSQNVIIGMSTYNSVNFSYADFTNAIEHSFPGFLLKEKTIEGWAIRDATITGAKIDNGTITDSNIADSTITGSKFEDGTITGSKIDNSTITNSHIADGTLDGSTKIKNATISFEKVDKSFITDLTSTDAYIANLITNVANINTLSANDAIIKNIFSDKIISDEAVLNTLKTHIVDADYIKAVVIDVGALTADEADIRYATIDFSNVTMETVKNLYADSGILTDATIVDGNVTGRLNGVKINADVIDAGTLSTDRLLVTGEDGIVYQINVNSSGLSMSELEDPKYQKYLNGTDIVANSITATQIATNTLTANEINAKSIAGAVGEFIEINAGQITSGKIASSLIDADSILSQKVIIGGELVTVKPDDASSMVEKIEGIGGSAQHGVYVGNNDMRYKNIVPLCGFTKNKFSVGDKIKVNGTIRVSGTYSGAELRSFIQFYNENKNGSPENYMYIEMRSISSTRIDLSGLGGKDIDISNGDIDLEITEKNARFQLGDGDVENGYFVIGLMYTYEDDIKGNYPDVTLYVRNASFISGIPGLTVNGDISVNGGEINAETVHGTLEGSAYVDFLKNTGRSYLNGVFCNSEGSLPGGNNLGVSLYPQGGIWVVSEESRMLQIESNKIQCLTNDLTIGAGGNINMESTVIANRITAHGKYNATASDRFWVSALQIRENDLVGNAHNGLGYAPAISFHWANMVAGTLAFDANGKYRFLKQNGTSDATIKASIETSSLLPSTTNKVDIGSSAYKFKDIYVDSLKAKTSGNFTYWKFTDGTLKILWRGRLNSSLSVNNANANVYMALNPGENFPVSFKEMPSAFCSVTTPDLSAPFVSMSVDGVTTTKFGRWIVFADYPTTLPTGTVLSAMFIGKWK